MLIMQFFKGYDRLLSRYMRHGEGIGQDLTLVGAPLLQASLMWCPQAKIDTVAPTGFDSTQRPGDPGQSTAGLW